MVLGAVKRTEPYARLAKTLGNVPVARYTLLEKPKPWWTTLLHGFQKKRHGGSRNWAIIASCIVYILAILGISPISAALLSSKEVQKGDTESFVRLALRNDSAHPLQPRAKRDTYLQTTGAILKNYSTSPWITDDYLIMPFWPSNSPHVESPWTFRSLQADSWEANTTVFRNDFVCTDLRLSKKDMYLRHAVNSSDSMNDETLRYNKTYVASVLLESDHGCHFNLTVNATAQYGYENVEVTGNWISWGDSHRIMFRDEYSKDAIVRLNEECPEDEIILMSTPWWEEYTKPEKLFNNLTVQAYACHSEHTMADIPVRILGKPERQSVQFDEEMFHRIRTPITPAMVDLQELRNIYKSVAWSDFIPQKPSSSMKKGFFGGSAAVLGRGYNFSIPEMMADPNLLARAGRFRRRFFAEIIGATLQHNTISVSQQQQMAGVSYGSSRQVVVSGQAAYILCALLATSFCALLGIIWWVRPTKRNLGLYCDPSMVLGVAQWASGNRSVLSEFRRLDLATRKSLKEDLTNRLFVTREGGLHELGERVNSEITPPDQEKARSARTTKGDTSSSVLPELRLRNMACLLLYISGLLAGMVVLFQFAQRSQLHQAFFTYRANVMLFGNESTISPFAIIPTVLAVVIALWWESIDSTCRSVQPYISMYKGAATPLQSTGLELRQVPLTQVLKIEISEYEWAHGPSMGPSSKEYSLLTSDLYDMKADWMYTAIIQTALGGPAPAWSKDDWSFVPISLSPENLLDAMNTVPGPEGVTIPATLRFQTPALRARLDCSAIDMAKNTSTWITFQNSTTNTTSLKSFYRLYESMFRDPHRNLTTSVTAQGVSPQCCGNVTDSTIEERTYNPAVISYWTENWLSDGSSIIGRGNNFTIKWIRGPTSFAELSGYAGIRHMIFSEAPVMQALDCMPTFEASEAEVLVDLTSGTVQDYRILSAPVSDDVAWSDSWVYRNLTEKPPIQNGTAWDERNYFDVNVTTSYGIYFMKSILRSACLMMTGSYQLGHPSNQYDDRLDDKVFNMRDNTTGLNMDFMSYAAYAQVKLDPTALLNADVLLNTSRKIFSTFFQHFANNNVSPKDGGYVYQPAGLHDDMTPPTINYKDAKPLTPNGDIAPRFQDVHRNTNKTTSATLSTRVEILQINSVAFWIATSILIWLIVTITIFAAVQRRYYSGMMRNVECIADVLALIAGSDQLLAAVTEQGVDTMLTQNKILTRLGWFRDPDGTMRWRIEVVHGEEGMRLRPIPLGASYTPVARDDDEDEEALTLREEDRAALGEQSGDVRV
ncbi:hypothetical protein C7974DRAFT_319174 [Boeremia exigua]|uniref:uncharacterized protein n=1 Tax=Boeremia exigua TaxID=749465 RepID=UPI001E8E817D|nr:uncharacterized protein C7974DRAFT_319174 [Boeremia exigua]KAH6616889.1 hypothetical protein C7974DRAFT_319174 [Boeremia exigua]